MVDSELSLCTIGMNIRESTPFVLKDFWYSMPYRIGTEGTGLLDVLTETP